MGFFDFLKKKKDKSKLALLQGQDWASSFYSQFGNNIYNSIVVQQAINCIVRECKKLQPQHIIKKGERTQKVNDNLQSVLDNPNPLMTTTDFIEKIIWNLYFNYNSFVLPIKSDEGELLALYPLQPLNVEFLQDEKDKIYIKFSFANNYQLTVGYQDIIHIKYNYSLSDFMGGDKRGQPNNEALLDTLNLNENLLKGIAKALKASYSITGLVKYNSLLDDGKIQAEIKEFERKIDEGNSGILGLDMRGDYQNFTRQVQIVDQATLDFVDSQILRFFGVPLCILKGDYTKLQYEAFYQKTIEPLVVSLNQAFTKTLFSQRQKQGWGHKIIFSHKELEFMTTNEKIQWMTLASNVGAITINEMREIIGYPVYEDEALGNTPVMSKNYGDALSVKDVPPREVE